VNGTTIATAFTTTGVAEVSATGYYRVNGGISAPDDGGTLEWYLNNAGAAGAFLSAVAIEPAPNQADQAAGLRAALGLASANVDTQLSAINSKTTNLPASFPVVDGSGRVTVGTNNDKTGYSLDSSQTFSTTGSVGSVTGAVGSVTSPVTAGTVSDKTGYSLSSSQTFNLTGNITGNLSGSVGSVTGAVGSVTGAVGSVTGAVTVGTLNNNVITANAIATDAIDAAAIATDAVTEIQAGLATQASVDTKASQVSVDALNAKADDITALVL
jgi:hypothetical protein